MLRTEVGLSSMEHYLDYCANLVMGMGHSFEIQQTVKKRWVAPQLDSTCKSKSQIYMHTCVMCHDRSHGDFPAGNVRAIIEFFGGSRNWKGCWTKEATTFVVLTTWIFIHSCCSSPAVDDALCQNKKHNIYMYIYIKPKLIFFWPCQLDNFDRSIINLNDIDLVLVLTCTWYKRGLFSIPCLKAF